MSFRAWYDDFPIYILTLDALLNEIGDLYYFINDSFDISIDIDKNRFHLSDNLYPHRSLNEFFISIQREYFSFFMDNL